MITRKLMKNFGARITVLAFEPTTRLTGCGNAEVGLERHHLTEERL